MTAGISLIPGKTGAHRAPLQLLDSSFSAAFMLRPIGLALRALLCKEGKIAIHSGQILGGFHETMFCPWFSGNVRFEFESAGRHRFWRVQKLTLHAN